MNTISTSSVVNRYTVHIYVLTQATTVAASAVSCLCGRMIMWYHPLQQTKHRPLDFPPTCLYTAHWWYGRDIGWCVAYSNVMPLTMFHFHTNPVRIQNYSTQLEVVVATDKDTLSLIVDDGSGNLQIKYKFK